MPFTGKATFSAGPALPEIAEDVSDIIGLVSPFETPLLDHLGDPHRAATATVHQWLEDTLLPNADTIDDQSITNPTSETAFTVENAARFQTGDQIKVDGSQEVMLVESVNTGSNELTVTRGYGGTTPEALADNQIINILGNAALEGDDRPATRFTNRTRMTNYTQIFTASVEVSGSQLATRQIALADELDYQKQERLRELIRDLENSVINGVASDSSPEGSATVRRSLKGIIPSITTNAFVNGAAGFPSGSGAGSDTLTEEQINVALRTIWEQSSGAIDTIVVNGFQKRQINSFITSSRQYGPRDENFRDLVSVYESDFGVCRVVMSRWVPADTVLLVDSTRVDVLPLVGRSFHFKRIAPVGDAEVGQVIGEYTLEFRNENAHGLIRGLATT